jgi:hypothetical protein
MPYAARNRFTVDDLIRIAPPPDIPVDRGLPSQWNDIELILGTPLPGDYKAFINAYGTGYFNDLFHVFNPFSGSDRANTRMFPRGRGRLPRDDRSSLSN